MRLAAMIFATTLSACGIKTKTTLAANAPPIQGRSGPVCLFAGSLPPEYKYIEIGRITATKRTYGSTDQVVRAIAAEARRLGAVAVINLQADQRFKGPLPWRIASPTGDGVAVKLMSESSELKCEDAGGRLG
jgi:hypothetical protein